MQKYIKNCDVCKKDFTTLVKKQMYCTKTCKGKSHNIKISKKPISKICNYCDNVFAPYTGLDKFCSYECRNNNVKSKRSRNWNKESCEKRKGENNPGYKHGMRVKEKSVTFSRIFIKNCKELDEILINKKGYLYCEECGTTNTLKFEHHHLIYRSEKPKHEHLHDIRNILMCCIKCHNQFHRHKSKRNDIVKQRELHLLFGNDILDK